MMDKGLMDEHGRSFSSNVEIYSEKYVSARRTYYLDAKKNNQLNSRFITITESRKHNGAKQRSRVFISEEDVAEFLAALQRVAAELGHT